MADPSEGWRARIDAALDAALPPIQAPPTRLHAAMRHAVLLGGKRMRPLLVYAAGTAFGARADVLDAPAVAVELVHAYSLVHDDLPCMDDDALRRGQLTVHVAFDEATAVLAGDALQSLAFATLAAAPVDAAARVAMLSELAAASGCGRHVRRAGARHRSHGPGWHDPPGGAGAAAPHEDRRAASILCAPGRAGRGRRFRDTRGA
jgi:farnesyl diphosphate synthase